MKRLERVFLMNVGLYLNAMESIFNFIQVNKKCGSAINDLKINSYIEINEKMERGVKTKKFATKYSKFILRTFPNIETLQCSEELLFEGCDCGLISKVTNIRMVHKKIYYGLQHIYYIKSSLDKIENIYVDDRKWYYNSNLHLFTNLKRIWFEYGSCYFPISEIVEKISKTNLKQIIIQNGNRNIDEIINVLNILKNKPLNKEFMMSVSFNKKIEDEEKLKKLKEANVKIVYVHGDEIINNSVFMSDLLIINGRLNLSQMAEININRQFIQNQQNNTTQKINYSNESDIRNKIEEYLKVEQNLNYRRNEINRVIEPNVTDIYFYMRLLYYLSLVRVSSISVNKIKCSSISLSNCSNVKLNDISTDSIDISFCNNIEFNNKQQESSIKISDCSNILIKGNENSQHITCLEIMKTKEFSINNQNINRLIITESCDGSINRCQIINMVITKSCCINCDKNTSFIGKKPSFTLKQSVNNSIIIPSSISFLEIESNLSGLEFNNPFFKPYQLIAKINSLIKENGHYRLFFTEIQPIVSIPFKCDVSIQQKTLKQLKLGKCQKLSLTLHSSAYFECEEVEVLQLLTQNINIKANRIGELVLTEKSSINNIDCKLIGKRIYDFELDSYEGKKEISSIPKSFFDEIQFSITGWYYNHTLNFTSVNTKKIVIKESTRSSSNLSLIIPSSVEDIFIGKNSNLIGLEGGSGSKKIRQLKLLISERIILKNQKESINRKQIKTVICENGVEELIVRNCKKLTEINCSSTIKTIHIQSCPLLNLIRNLNEKTRLKIINCPNLSLV